MDAGPILVTPGYQPGATAPGLQTLQTLLTLPGSHASAQDSIPHSALTDLVTRKQPEGPSAPNPPATVTTIPEEHLNPEPTANTGLLAPTETRVQSSGSSWCDVIWNPVLQAVSYIIFLRSRTISELNQQEHNLRYHLTIPDTLNIIKACRYRCEDMLPSRVYEIHVAASNAAQQIGPLSKTLMCRTAYSPLGIFRNPSPGNSNQFHETKHMLEKQSTQAVTVYKNRFCELVSTKRKRNDPTPAKPGSVPVVSCVVMGVAPRTASSCVQRTPWNAERAKTFQCKFPACGQIFKLHGNKTRHEKSCRRDVCEVTQDANGKPVFTLHCRWANCDYKRTITPKVSSQQSSDGLSNLEIQDEITEEFMAHLEEHMPHVSTKVQRTAQVWCQWRGCHKAPMYAQSLHRHVRECHVGFGNRYNTGQGGVPLQTHGSDVEVPDQKSETQVQPPPVLQQQQYAEQETYCPPTQHQLHPGPVFPPYPAHPYGHSIPPAPVNGIPAHLMSQHSYAQQFAIQQQLQQQLHHQKQQVAQHSYVQMPVYPLADIEPSMNVATASAFLEGYIPIDDINGPQ